MAINLREVMKGCILSYEGQPRIVKAINEFILFENKKEWIGGSQIDGEPVSENWLKAFGFEPIDSDAWSNRKMEVIFSNGNLRVPYLDTSYGYCHQLQILHFVVTGEHLPVPKLKSK